MAIFTTSALIAAATATAISAQPPPAPHGFRLYANAFLDSTRTPATRITAEVPFRHLVFLKKQGLFDARYDVYVSIQREIEDEEPDVDTYVLHGYATVQTYDETKKQDLRSRTSRIFKLPPGDYHISALLRVKQTLIAMRQEVDLRVPDFLSSGIGFGTPTVYTVSSRAPVGFFSARDSTGKRSDADESSTSVTFERQPAVSFSLYLDRPVREPIPCDVFYEVVDPEDRQMLYGKHTVAIGGERDEYVVVFNVDDWAPGLYRLNLRAVAHDPDRDATTSADIRIDVTRAMLGVNFEETLDILSLIAGKDELLVLKNAPEERRAEAWAAFWKRRDPDPSTPQNEALDQYLARVHYVVREFSQLGPGWRSDRGRVYIKYGPPDQIDTAADDRGQGQYLIWRYFSPSRTFVFYDVIGVGDYKLVEGDLL